MATKLWEKDIKVDKKIEAFTIGKDNLTDLLLAKYDIIGSIAHICMLEAVGLLPAKELTQLTKALKDIYLSVEKGEFTIENGVEDVHSQVELILTNTLGDIGKKIHSGRSRNDQILLDIKLFTRVEIEKTVESVSHLFNLCIAQSERYKNILLPGYTHLQIAMPSSFGLWFGAYAESLADDLQLLLAAWKITNRNPLGSAAGYGSSFPLDRQMTTDLLGFDTMNYNVVYAQMGRGKMERILSNTLASVAATLSKLASDACLFSSQNFGFIRLPDKFTTGSSIMPHKKNPDVFELVRAKCNNLQALQYQITLITNNLPSGYFRDLQITKEIFVPAFDTLLECLDITTTILSEIEVNKEILSNPLYDYVFSVEEVNKLTLSGVPFREAYKKISEEIETGKFTPHKTVHHTHQGSIGNLCNEQICAYRDAILSQFSFKKANKAIEKLLSFV